MFFAIQTKKVKFLNINFVWIILFAVCFVFTNACFVSDRSDNSQKKVSKCSPGISKKANLQTDKNIKPERGGNLTVRISREPGSLISIIDPDYLVRTISDHMIFESLVRLSYDFTKSDKNKDVNNYLIHPELAKSWEISPDGLTYTFIINSKARWHDGRKVTPKDVKETFELVLDPLSNLAVGTDLANISQINILDDSSVEITVFHPQTDFLVSISQIPVMPSHRVGRMLYATHPLSRSPVGSGPFKFSRWIPGHISIVRNENYHGKKPFLDRVTYLVITQDRTAANLFRQGKIDILFDSSRYGLSETTLEKVNSYDYSSGQLSLLLFNNKTGLFSNESVRKAVVSLLDIETVKKHILDCCFSDLKSAGVVMSGVHKRHKFDIRFSANLLRNAGFKDVDNLGILENSQGQELKFTLILSDDEKYLIPFTALFEQDLKRKKISMKTVFLNRKVFQRRLNAGSFDAAVTSLPVFPKLDMKKRILEKTHFVPLFIAKRKALARQDVMGVHFVGGQLKIKEIWRMGGKK